MNKTYSYSFNLSKKADIWISTVLYTLIAIAIIGTLLAVVRPRIDEMRDHYLIEQTINAMNKIDETVTAVKSAQGTTLSVSFQLSRGTLLVDPAKKIIEWRIPDSRYQYSEAGFPVDFGNIKVQTDKSYDRWNVSLKLNYSDLTISLDNKSESKIFQPSSAPYMIWIKNQGSDGAVLPKLKVDFTID